MANGNGNLLAVPISSTVNGNSSTGICVDHVSNFLIPFKGVSKEDIRFLGR